MQQQDQTNKRETPEPRESTPSEHDRESNETHVFTDVEDSTNAIASASEPQRGGFDWLALVVALVIAAFFALTARFNSQPSPSFIPAAVFSATGCGLLITALRKVRGRTGAGLREAGLAGFGLALFQFAITFTYPDVLTTVRTIPELGHAFLVTWGLLGLFAVVLSLVGAAIGHLAFAPLRALPARTAKQSSVEEDGEEEEEETPQLAGTNEAVVDETLQSGQANGIAEVEDEKEAEEEEDAESTGVAAQPRSLLANYAVTILLLALLPMMAGYVFAAVYDFAMNALNINHISPGVFPTLSLLSGLLPWRLAAPINLLSANGSFIVFTLLWRIPDSVLGNPNVFDIQALEPLLFNAAALAFLLVTMYGNEKRANGERPAAPWGAFLLLEALLGLIIILPANLWLLRGLEGVLLFGNQAIQLPTTQLINPTLFALNLVTGVIVCLLIGVIVRRQYQLWTTPRQVAGEEE
jgi:hypothetical protein